VRGRLETRVGIFVLAAIGILIYMGFHIGAFRFDVGKYASYTIYFKDVSGLARKAEVRIAGVKVGWLEELTLDTNGQMQAVANIMVLKDFNLYSNAHAVVRQDGLLGRKFVEIVPGDPLLTKLDSGDALSKPSVAPVNIDEILLQMKDIAENVEDVTKSFRSAIGGVQGEVKLNSIFCNLEDASQKLASLSDTIDRNITKHEGRIEEILMIGENVNKVAQRLDECVLPSFQDGIEKISNVFDRDFDRVAGNIGEATNSLNDALSQARDGFKHISSVAEKVDDGKGLLGKLINEEETYRDLKVAAQGIKNYFSRVERLQVIFDAHFETMCRPAENFRYEDGKGYFDVRIHPNEDYFYMIQLAASQKGYIHRKEVLRGYADECGNHVDTCQLDLRDRDRLRFTFRKKKQKIKRNTLKLGLQFGKIFGPIAMRFGLFEGSTGLGVDFDIPFNNDKFRWVTSIEGFDFNGWNRIEDRRPHLKWLNRIYMLNNIYMTFGADDFISKHNANVFFGAGIRFGDDDVKYLIGNAGGLAGAFN